ncbi:hypothetical protein APHAL10511_004231 [Amanita phalloides]|nr:hypothetical protein APHAL10511_004231 [Amanita phalloides]
MLVQYGSLLEHSTEEATSRFLSPIFNHLVAEFGFSFRNLPESLIKGRITTKGKIEYCLKAFGSVSILVMEVKLRCGGTEERLDAIAQVIAECDVCDWNNSTQNFSVPLFGILWDGTYFHFFKFDGTSKPPSFLRGAFSADPIKFRRGIKLPDLTDADESALPFIRTVRLISEVVFDLFLSGYVSSIEAFCDQSSVRSAKEGTRKSLTRWEDGLTSAQQALHHFRDAESKRQGRDKTGADQAVSHAQMLLKRR